MLIEATTFDIAAQTIGFGGMALNIAMRAMTGDRQLKMIGVVATAVWTLHFAMLSAWVGASCNAVEAVVMLLSLGTVPKVVRWALAVLPAMPAPWLVAGLNDALPIVSTVMCNFGLMFAKGIPLRMVLLATAALWLVYDFANGSISGVLTEAVSIGTLLVTIWRMRAAMATVETGT